MITVDVDAVEVEELGAAGAQNAHIFGEREFLAEVGTHDALVAGAELVDVCPILSVFGDLDFHVIATVQVAGK